MFTRKRFLPIAIDIGTHEIHAAQLAAAGDSFKVSALARGTLQGTGGQVEGPLDPFIPVIKELVARNPHFRGKRAVMHLPPGEILHFPLQFRLGKTGSAEQAILKESQAHLPFPLQEALLDYPSLVSGYSADPTECKALIVAAKRQRVESYCRMVGKAGLSAEAIDFPLCSLIRLHTHLYGCIQEASVLCHIGTGETLLSVVAADRIIGHRTVPWGLQTVSNRLTSQLKLPGQGENACALLRTHGLSYETREEGPEGPSAAAGGDGADNDMRRAVYQIITPVLEDLTYELHKMVGYAKSEKRDALLSGICLYGHAVLIKGLAVYLESRVNIPVLVVDPLQKMGPPGRGAPGNAFEGGSFAVALGLALRELP